MKREPTLPERPKRVILTRVCVLVSRKVDRISHAQLYNRLPLSIAESLGTFPATR
jgi:hypothetical protein